ncbi:MAG: helix-turn-helix transcriptional regulator [Patescibacteria group bacterium]
MREYIINRVFETRQRAELTQEALAEAVGVTRQTIIALERGNYVPSVLLALKIARCFKQPIEKIFTYHYEK